MLKAVYVLQEDYQNESWQANFQKQLGEIFDDCATFEPIAYENEKNCNSIFTKNEVVELIKNGKIDEILKSVMKKFDALKAKFIVVVGCGLEFLDLELAKSLNAPFFLSKESSHKKNLLKFTSISDVSEITTTSSQWITPLRFESMLYEKARANLKSVVLPESNDDRVLRACDILLRSGAVGITLLGEEEAILARAGELGLNLKSAKIIDPKTSELRKEFAKTLYELRKAKGMELQKAHELMGDRTYFGTMLVYKGLADAMVSGASTTSAETIRPALQFIKTKPGVSSVSGSFIICLDGYVQFYADCAVSPNPTPQILASTAIATAATAREFGFEPKVAMLSYSTGSSGSGPAVDAVISATNILRELEPELKADGPLQFDAAMDPAVGAKKLPGSPVAGEANVFVFPDLNCGNICYKAVQRTAGAVAIGPILQGLNKPINDLSRGCLVEDIVNTVLISAIQGQ